MNTLSVIVPCYFEEETLPALFSQLRPLQNASSAIEILFVDGGSRDQTQGLLAASGFKWIESPSGRARQMNAGAKLVSGDFLLFLHCDTVLPQGFSEQWQDLLSHNPAWGFFNVALSGQSWIYRVIERGINLRSRISRVATGDQAIFVRKDIWQKVKGFEDIPLMEDVALTKRLRALAKPYVIPLSVITSSRRWEKNGWLRTVLLMWFLRFAYWLGVKPSRLARLYANHKA